MRKTLPENPNDSIDYSKARLREIYLAGGCFWGVQAYMRRVKGVARTSVGYANGNTKNPAYEDVCRGDTGYAETVHVLYDPQKISLDGILEEFFSITNPTSFNRQGNDIGPQYRSGIYFTDEKDESSILEYIEKIRPLYDKKLVVEIKPLENYYPAEDYHQSYLEKNPDGYCHITF